MNKLLEIYKKHFVVITVAMFCLVVAGNVYAGEVTVYDNGYAKLVHINVHERIVGNTAEGSIAGMMIGALIGVYVASVLLPLIANRTTTLESNDDLDSNEQSLVGTWVLFIVLGVMGAIIGMAF